MRKVDRNSVRCPASLEAALPGRTEQSKGARELANNIAAPGKTPPEPRKFEAYKGEDVKAALIALFHGKCAYCESVYASTAPVDVEHFRPKGEVAEDKEHPGYWWLAADWNNLLPSCIDCNRRRYQHIADPASDTQRELAGKKDHFPVSGVRVRDIGDLSDERPLLLDPCLDEPGEHLTFHLEPPAQLALTLPRNNSERGKAAIRVHGLNRLALVQERTRILRRLQLMRDILHKLEEAKHMIEALPGEQPKAALKPISAASARIVQDMRSMAEPDRPFSAMVAQWLDDWGKELRQ